jgi:assimilatory nitrate reductase electron transfer subunit
VSRRQVVVVGYGMAGARLAEEIRRRDPGADRVELTVLGTEPHTAYNRVLLSTMMAGSMDRDAVRLHGPDWGHRHRVNLRLASTVTRIDRHRRLVELASGPAARYDALVLATGSRPWIPPTPGLTGGDGRLADGVLHFYTLDDCEGIIRAAAGRVPVAVLGGGLLGLEVAAGLAGRGNPVTVVHPAGHLMERQLDPDAGRMLARVLAGTGVRFRLGRTAAGYRPGQGLELDDGSRVDAGLVVVCAGARAETRLARDAGLDVRAGIVVDDGLRTTDPDVYAIGDCVEHRGLVRGLVQPAWEQARVLADLLTGADRAASYRGTAPVTRLKASGVELAAMGQVQVGPDFGVDGLVEPTAPVGFSIEATLGSAAAAAPEVLSLQDPARGRYAKLVLHDDRVVGAIMLGLPDAVANVSHLFDRGLPAPADRLALLLGRALPPEQAAAGPADLPADAVVCLCNTVTKGHLLAAQQAGARTFHDLVAATRATRGCGSCRSAVQSLADWLSGAGGAAAA